MTLNEYQELAMRTLNPKVREPILEGLMGLNGEAGESIELLKKTMFQGHELDDDRLIEELGDCLWYVAETAHGLGIPLDIIAQENIRKLAKRFPEGFSEKMSINR